jgi:hypothetical protein
MTSQEEMPDGFPESTYATLANVEASVNSLARDILSVPPSGAAAMMAVRMVEALVEASEQIDLSTHHVLHGGMYSRTIHLDGGTIITGALIKIPTLLVFSGNAYVLIGTEWVDFEGYGVIPASAGRKQAFVARTPVDLTMIFPTQAKTVEEAEREFTDDADRLMSRRSTRDVVVITGE